jgi:hypothetical protein
VSDITGIAVVTIVAGSAAIAAGRKLLERRRARRALREKPVLDATSPDGSEVRVTGTVRITGEVLEAPLSGRRCVVFRARVYRHNGITGRARVPYEQLRMVPFAIERDDGTRVTVEGEHVLLDLDPIKKLRPDDARRSQLGFSVGLSVRDMRGATFEEIVVEEGARIAIGGLMMKDLAEAPPSGERAFREAPPPAVRIAGAGALPLAIGPA